MYFIDRVTIDGIYYTSRLDRFLHEVCRTSQSEWSSHLSDECYISLHHANIESIGTRQTNTVSTHSIACFFGIPTLTS